METDRHYFFEGLFIIGFVIAAAVFAVWLGSPGRHDDVLYRIHFSESVSGLSVGDQVKFRGVDVGTVKSIMIDPDNSSLVLVELQLRKDTPVKTDTRASLALKGPTGAVFIELSGGDPAAETLLAVTPPDTIPEIPSEKTGLKAMLDELPKLVAKFGALEGEIKKIVANARALTEKLKADPSLLFRSPEKKEKKEKKEKTKEEENNDHAWE